MAVNQPLVERKITLILADLPRVVELAAMSVEAYLADPRNEVLAERYLERLIHQSLVRVTAELPSFLKAVKAFLAGR